MYQSSAEIKLDIESDASEFGIGGFFEEKSLSILSGEVELIKSKLFLRKVIDSIDLTVNYFTVGTMLTDEKYPSSPIVLDFSLKSDNWINKRIDVDFVDDHQYMIGLANEEKPKTVYTIGEKVILEDIEFTLYTDPSFEDINENKFFIIINSIESLLDYLDRNLEVEFLNLKANTIKVSFQDHNPYKAHDIVEAVTNMYIAYTQQEKSLANTKKIRWIDNQLGKINDELENYEDYFENFTIKNRTSNLEEDLKITINAINVIDSQRFNLTSAIEALEELESAMHSITTINPSKLFPPALVASVNRYNELLLEREQLGLSYKETTYAMQQKEKEIASIKNGISEQISALILTDKNELQNLNIKRRRLESSFAQIPGKNTEFNKNQRYYNLYEEFYLSLMQSKAEFEIAVAGLIPNFKILSSASFPSLPIYPKKIIIYGIGLISGLVLCLFFIGIQYILDDKIGTIEELEALTSLPVLGAIPMSKIKIKTSKVIVGDHPKSSVSESLRNIRTNIQFMLPSKGPKVITISSTVGGEGKTFIALNLAGILAMSNKKVIIVDLDMRKPRIHHAFNVEGHSKGISTALIEKDTLNDCIATSPIDNLDFISSGPIPPNPSELLLNGRFTTILEQLKEKYDIILLDTPPVGLVTDGILALKNSNLGLLVVRADYSQKKALREIKRVLNTDTCSLAYILNGTSHTSKYGYEHGYYSDSK